MLEFRLPDRRHHPLVEGDFLTRYYHAPLLRNFFVGRLELAYRFIRGKRFSRILEIGFGSGVFFPQLKNSADEIYAIDIHSNFNEVSQMLRYENLKVHLVKANIMHLPFKDASFDCVISMSALEHIEPLAYAVGDIFRVLKDYGLAVLGFPVANKLTDFLLRALGSEADHKKKLKEIHPNTHNDIIYEVKKYFGNIQIKKIPNFLPLDFSLYCGCLCKKVVKNAF